MSLIKKVVINSNIIRGWLLMAAGGVLEGSAGIA
jgi:hypothetical protein